MEETYNVDLAIFRCHMNSACSINIILLEFETVLMKNKNDFTKASGTCEPQERNAVVITKGPTVMIFKESRSNDVEKTLLSRSGAQIFQERDFFQGRMLS